MIYCSAIYKDIIAIKPHIKGHNNSPALYTKFFISYSQIKNIIKFLSIFSLKFGNNRYACFHRLDHGSYAYALFEKNSFKSF